MLKNYERNKDDVIYQVDVSVIKYDKEYIDNRYSSYPTTPMMSHLRLGYLLGILDFHPNSLLDVGYGNGDFLKTASTIINQCYGCDIEPAFPLPQHITAMETMYDRHYDVVCFFDSLEHFDDIYEIKNLDTKYILISVPWCHYIDDTWFKNWKHRRENEHLWHFNLASLKNFMGEIGFEYVTHSNVEDAIRKPIDNLPNILTALFKKI
jgi:hypothetical protein